MATTGTYVADSGFRPDVDGFSFPNYTNDSRPTNLGAAELRALFGDDVCTAVIDDRCRLSSPAVSWLSQTNAMMSGGHCEGMAVLSQLFDAGVRSPSTFGGDSAFELRRTQSPGLESAIARWFITQATSPAQDARRTDLTPTQVVEQLRATLGQPRTPDNTYTIALFQPGLNGGHAVTPYAIEDRGDGVMWIMIYDNNHPGVPRAIEVDTIADTWSYRAAQNLDADENLYEGDASTKTLWLTPLADRIVPQSCPFCAMEIGQESEERFELSLTGAGANLTSTDFYLTDEADRVVGRRGGATVSEIDGASGVPLMTTQGDDPAPVLDIPALFDVYVTIAANDGHAAEDMTFALVGHNYDVFISGIDVDAGAKDFIDLSKDGSSVSYQSHRTSTPTIDLATGNTRGDLFDIRVTATSFDSPASVILTSGATADLMIDGSDGAEYRVEVDRASPDGSTTTVAVSNLRVEKGELVTLPLESWTTGTDLDARIHAARGTERQVRLKVTPD